MGKQLMLRSLMAFCLWCYAAAAQILIPITGGTSILGTVATPTDSPGAGTYSSTQSVTLSSATSGAWICYTTDGSTPVGTADSCSTGTHYTVAISVASTTTIKAIAYKTQYFSSALLSSMYVIGISQHTLDTDNFGGVAGTLLHSYNAKWEPIDAFNFFDCAISTPNGKAKASTAPGFDYNTGSAWTNDQFAQATLVTMPTSTAQVCVRLTQAGGHFNGGYCVGPDPNVNGLFYRLFGNVTLLASSATAAENNDVVNIQAVGSTITVTVNGTVLSDLTTVDSSYTTGSPGFRIDDATGAISTWSAGSVN